MGERCVKVLFIPQWYPPTQGENRAVGSFCRDHVFASALRDHIAVLVFKLVPRTMGRWPSLKMEFIDDEGVPTWYAHGGRSPIPGTSEPFFWLNLWRAIRRVVNIWGKPDVIHTQDAWAYPVMKTSRLLGVPYVISQHSTAFLRRETLSPRKLNEFRWAFANAQRVLPANQRAEHDYEHYGFRASVRWLPNALNTNIFFPDNSSIRESSLLHVSGFTPQKRVPDIIKAFAQVVQQRPNSMLHFAGEGEHRHAVEKLAEESLPLNSFKFHGYLPKHKLADLMRKSSGFIFPSSAETFGCVLMEAMACGCPVLTTQVGGIPAVVRQEHQEGIFVRVGDIDAIAEGMLRLLDGTHGIDVGRISQEIRERFGYNAIAEILHEEYLHAICGM